MTTRTTRRTGTLTAVAIVALSFVVVWFAMRDENTPRPADATPDTTSTVPAPLPASANGAETNAPQGHSERDVAVPEPSPVAEALATFRGRCVAAEDGRPLAGCEVKATPEYVVTTAADGTFAVAHPPGRGSLTFTASMRAQRVVNVGPVDAGATQQVGDVTLARGFVITGRVVDPAGAAVPDVGVAAFGVGVGADGRNEFSSVGGRTRSDGAFTMEPLLGAGRWHAMVAERPLRDDADFVVDPDNGAPPLLLVVAAQRPVRTLRGVVVDDVGDPVADVVLETVRANANATTNAEGVFSIAARPSSDDDVLMVRVAGRCDADATPRPVRWGSEDLRIVLRRAPSLTVDVVDDAGAPVTEFGVLLQADLNPAMGDEHSRLHGTHENGRVVVAPARRGRSILRVFPHATDLVASEPLAIEITDAMPPLRVVVERALPCPVEVVDTTGAPVAAAKVELVRTRGPLTGSFGPSRELGKDGRPALWYRRSTQPEHIAVATTDAAGHAMLLAPRTLHGTLLRCDVPAFAPLHLVEPSLRPGAPLRIDLAGNGTIVGKVVLDGTPPAAVRVELRGVGTNVRSWDTAFASLDADGAFRFDRVTAGTWTVVACAQVVWSSGTSMQTSTVPLSATERSVVVVAGTTTTVELASVPRATGVVRGVVRCDTLDLRGWSVDLVRTDANARLGAFTLSNDGSFVANGVLPGRYRLALHSSPDSSGLGSVLADEFDVAADATIVREVTFVPRRVVVDLQNPDGSPFVGRFDMRCGSQIQWNETGPRFVLDPAPELPISFRADPDGEWSAPVQASRERGEFTTSVVVPPKLR